MTINMADAYSVGALHALTRQMVHDRRNGGTINITDRFDFNTANSFEVAITTLGNWKQNEDGTIKLWLKNEHLIVRVEASDEWTLKDENSDEEGLRFSRLAIHLKNPAKRGYVKLGFSLDGP
jgi:hypothetical protein